MDTTITARNLEITDRFRDYATEKAEKVEHLAPKAIALEVKVTRRTEARGGNSENKVELMLFGRGPLVKAEASGSDKFAAFDIALDKLLERLRAAKDRRKVHRGQHRPLSLAEASADGFSAVHVTPAAPEVLAAVATGAPLPSENGEDEGEYTPVVIREKVFPAARMHSEEAVDHMELVGHDFYLFIDAATERPSVVYRRKGWAYGVISLDPELVDERADAAARA